MVGNGHERNEQLEVIIELIEGMVQEEGYKTVRFSNTEHGTTSYDCLVLRDCEDKEFTIHFDESFKFNRKGLFERTNYVK